MAVVLVTLGAVLTIGSIVPYLLDIAKKSTKPRVVSWFNWSLLTVVAGLASLSDHQYPAAIISFAAALETGLVVVLGWKHGDRRFDRTDILCQSGALLGLSLWLIFNSPAIAVLMSVGIDFVAAIPTLKHSWQKPYEETISMFAICTVSGLIVLPAVQEVSLTALTYPIYIAAVNATLATILLTRRKVATQNLKVL